MQATGQEEGFLTKAEAKVLQAILQEEKVGLTRTLYGHARWHKSTQPISHIRA